MTELKEGTTVFCSRTFRHKITTDRETNSFWNVKIETSKNLTKASDPPVNKAKGKIITDHMKTCLTEVFHNILYLPQ